MLLLYYVSPTTREVVLDSCPDSYYNININLGEKAEEQNNIGKFVLRHFKSVTVHLLGRLHQVSYSHLALKGLLTFLLKETPLHSIFMNILSVFSLERDISLLETFIDNYIVI